MKNSADKIMARRRAVVAAAEKELVVGAEFLGHVPNQLLDELALAAGPFDDRGCLFALHRWHPEVG